MCLENRTITEKKLRKSHHYIESKNVDLIETENRELIAREQGERGEMKWRS